MMKINRPFEDCFFSKDFGKQLKYSFVLWEKTLLPIEFGNYGLGGTAIVIINNILVGIFGSIANKVASIFLFLLGISALAIFCITGYAFLQKKKDLNSPQDF